MLPSQYALKFNRMPYGYRAPYGIFYRFPFLPVHKPQKYTHFLRLFPLAYRIHFPPYYQKNTPIFLAFFTFSSLFIPFLTKMTPFSPPFCPLQTVFTDFSFQNNAPLLSVSSPSSKNETIFFAFFRFFLNIYRIRR